MNSAKHETKRNHDNGSSPIPTQPILFSLKIGFYAGLIWGLVRWLTTGLNFTSVSQAFLLDPFLPRKYLGYFYWQAAGLGAFILMSMLAGLIYVVLLGRLKGPWPGLLFGAGWWGIFYAGIGPWIGAVPPLATIGWNSIATDLCLFLMWGVFIGFSIAFEFHNEAHREPSSKARKGSTQPTS